MSDDQREINQSIVDYYKKLFTEEAEWRPKMDDVEFSNLNPQCAAELEKPFTEIEVHQALMDLNGDKAPGPDGWNIKFFQSCWNTIKEDLLAVFTDFHSSCRFVRSLNSTFIALIPKKEGAVEIKDYRPISLVGAVYKILSKVLASRLKQVMNTLISDYQHAFVGERQIMDAILIANEVLNSKVKSRATGLLCKLDIEKAFDHVNWDFLLYLLKRMGFGGRWCEWIKWCISTASFSILINGTPDGFFSSSRGLRQGDPLSPFLFILVMEAFSRMMKNAEEAGYLTGFSATGRSCELSISHLLFADDSMVFCGAELNQIGYLRCTLLGFEAVSGLRINLGKSEIMPVGFVPNMAELAAVFGCKIGSLPTQYLGMPLGANFKSKNCWEPVLERSRKRLAEWKVNYLSSGARLTLIKSVLSSLPTYYLSLFPAPCSVLKELERMQRNFLWGRGEGVFKHHLVNWKEVCKPFQFGGVGVRQLKVQNEALKGKWFWRFAHDSSSLWKRLIVVKYGEESGGWIANEGPRLFRKSLWSSIRRNWSSFQSCISWKLGNGNRIMFWHHNWMEIGLLSEVFPEIYALAVDKNAFVSDYLSEIGPNRVWTVLLRRSLNDWELDSFGLLLNLLYSLPVEDGADKMIWTLSKQECFTVKSFYQFLQGEENDDFPWVKLWKEPTPTKVAFFSWCATKGRILTLDNLKRRGYSIANRCSLCHRQEETIAHLLLHCKWSSELWSFTLSCFGIQMCFPEDLKQFLLAWWGHPVGRRKKKLWLMVPLCLFWILWKERNRRMFENVEISALRIKNLYLSCLFSWMEGGKDLDLSSFLSFIASMKL